MQPGKQALLNVRSKNPLSLISAQIGPQPLKHLEANVLATRRREALLQRVRVLDRCPDVVLAM